MGSFMTIFHIITMSYFPYNPHCVEELNYTKGYMKSRREAWGNYTEN